MLQDRNGNLASGAIASLVDDIGAVVIYREGLPMNVSVTMSISYVSTAKVDVCKPSILDLHAIRYTLWMRANLIGRVCGGGTETWD